RGLLEFRGRVEKLPDRYRLHPVPRPPLMSAWTGKGCADCGKKKGPKQKDNKRCYTCQRLADKAASQSAHGKRLEATYGISDKDYDELLEFQGGKCALCRWANGRTRRLSVDHDHKCAMGHDPKEGCPECVRGLLCRPCNNLLGHARDLVEFFERCISYL